MFRLPLSKYKYGKPASVNGQCLGNVFESQQAPRKWHCHSTLYGVRRTRTCCTGPRFRDRVSTRTLTPTLRLHGTVEPRGGVCPPCSLHQLHSQWPHAPGRNRKCWEETNGWMDAVQAGTPGSAESCAGYHNGNSWTIAVVCGCCLGAERKGGITSKSKRGTMYVRSRWFKSDQRR